MEAITASKARKMVEKSLGKVESLGFSPKAQVQINLFEEKLQEAIINKKTFVEIHFYSEFQKEAIQIIIDRGFKIWKVYQLKDESKHEAPLLLGNSKSKDGVCIGYKFYF